MCLLYHVTWLHPNGALQPQQYPALCEKSVSGQYCSVPVIVDRGQFPLPPQSTNLSASSSEEQQEATASTDTQDTAGSRRRRKVVGWVRPSRKKSKDDDDTVQKVRSGERALALAIAGPIVMCTGRARVVGGRVLLWKRWVCLLEHQHRRLQRVDLLGMDSIL